MRLGGDQGRDCRSLPRSAVRLVPSAALFVILVRHGQYPNLDQACGKIKISLGRNGTLTEGSAT